ncbi:MAG: 50S ribosomal protein L3 [Planctomycetota bacterium]
MADPLLDIPNRGILGKKVGMTRLFNEDGTDVPVTVIQAGPCAITQVKTTETDGYDAIQLGFEEIKGRSSTFQLIGHDAKASTAPMRFHRELRLEDGGAAEFELGSQVTAKDFADVPYIDVVATSKGKGTAGVMKRHNFKGKEASHGVERKHRSPGSVGGRSSNLGTGKPKKGIRMAGRMGNERVTVRNLPIVKIDEERGLILVKGPVPGPKDGVVFLRTSVRVWKRKRALINA